MNKSRLGTSSNRFVVTAPHHHQTSDGSSADEQEAPDFDLIPISLVCPFKHNSDSNASHFESPSNSLSSTSSSLQKFHFGDLKSLDSHLVSYHGLLFSNLKYCVLFLKEYLCYYAIQDASSNLSSSTEMISLESAQQLLEESQINTDLDVFSILGSLDAKFSSLYYINPTSNPKDLELRQSIQQKRLNEILDLQVKEREKGFSISRQCLFCKKVFTTIHELFSHMFKTHAFNIGLSDNLVFVEKFLDILEKKLLNLKCIYCEREFMSQIALRNHMRKKKHFKISPKNHLYDQFYIINYSEPGKDWTRLVKENYDSEDDKKDDAWDDWFDDSVQTFYCLFDNSSFDSADACLGYMIEKYNFDLKSLQSTFNLTFYEFIALINFIRIKSSNSLCFGCDERFGSYSDLATHMKNSRCSSAIPDKSSTIWADSKYLIPVVENDGLFSSIDSFDDDNEGKAS
ncbi:hypothetical protein BB560_001699 [Smittium megazygosporum]|uniref:C2H2-type domain-containing protein n=1 Tax=Smittium megazygosporum TaxID=133381 RepID=A0A2T9ZGW9_9FUNG|nr:hypothetical protein BB560_001699 [Smittium megazygosporum]